MGSESQHHIIVVLESQVGPLPANLELPGCTYEVRKYERSTAADVAGRIKDATIVVTCTIPISAEALSEDNCPNLKYIAVVASGTDNIDLATCKRRGIQVSNTANANTAAVSEHAIALYFAARRKIAETHNAVQADEWKAKGRLLGMLKDKTGKYPLSCEEEVFGMIGAGNIGKRIAHLAQSLGMKVLVADRKGVTKPRQGRTAFTDVLKQSTVLMVIIPKTPETLDLISIDEFKMMRHEAVVINVARGGIVNEAALLQALKDEHIAGAAVDVFEVEPASSFTCPLIGAGAKNLNLITTPHTAWLADSTDANLDRMTKENIEGWHGGKPLRLVI